MMRTNSHGAARRRYYTRYLAHYTRKNYMLLLLGGLFVVGVALGTLLVRSAGAQTVELMLRLIGDFSQRRRNQPFAQNMWAGLLSGMGLLLALFVSGFCAVTRPAIFLVPLLRGLGFGFSAASLYARYGASAAGFVAVFLLPGMVVSSMAMLFCCNESLRLSGSLWGLLRSRGDDPYSLRIYCARYIAAGALWTLAILLEATLYALLPNAFVLG